MKILFVSAYTEVLKTFIPLINHFKKYDLYVIAKYIPGSADYENSKSLIEKNKLPGSLIENEEFSSQRPKSYVAKIRKTLKVKKSAYRYYDKTNPDIIILGPDKNSFEKFIIRRAKKDLIPSICFQWSLGPITKKSFMETKQRLLFDEISKNKNSILKKIIKRILRLPLRFVDLLLGFRTPVYAPCYGGGNATYLAAIGNTSKLFFSSMGVNKKKIIVTGHPLIEKCFYSNDEDTVDIYNFLEIPLNYNYLLYCSAKYVETTNDYLQGKSLLEWRKEKVLSILESNYKGYIVIKLHPIEKIDIFKELEYISDKVKVIQSIDIIELIKKCGIFFTRYSTSAYYAMMYQKPVITHNYPPVPFGSYYAEIGGTIHVENNNDLKKNIKLIDNNDKKIFEIINNKKNMFLKEHLNIPSNSKTNSKKILPSLKKFEALIDQLLN